jgi:hypothetical protein
MYAMNKEEGGGNENGTGKRKARQHACALEASRLFNQTLEQMAWQVAVKMALSCYTTKSTSVPRYLMYP